MLTKENKTNDTTNVIGATPTNEMAQQNGLDEIDLWAMSVGQSEKGLNSMRPKKRHIG